MVRGALFGLTLLLTLHAGGQGVTSPVYHASGVIDTQTLRTAVDAEGNFFYARAFHTNFGVLDFDPGPGIVSRSAEEMNRVCYVAKVGPSLSLEWLKLLHTPNGFLEVSDIATDSEGNPILLGDYGRSGPGSDNIDFGEPGTPHVMQVRRHDAIIWKLDQDGRTLWVKIIPGGTSGCVDIHVGPDDRIYVAGMFLGDQDFDPGPAMHTLSATSGLNAFVLKLTADGLFTWVRHFAENSSGGLGLVQVDVDTDGSVYIGSPFVQQVDADPGPGIHRLFQGPILGDTLLVRLNANGDLVWALTTSKVEIDQLILDKVGGLLVGHEAEGITRYSEAGTLLWDHGAHEIENFVLGSDNDFYYVGTYRLIDSIGSGDGSANPPENGFSNVMLGRWTLDGTQLWFTTMPSLERSQHGGQEIYFSNGKLLINSLLNGATDVNPSTTAEHVLSPFTEEHVSSVLVQLRSAEQVWMSYIWQPIADGSFALPLRSLRSAMRAIQPGEPINIKSVDGGIVGLDTGQFSKPTTIKSFGGPVQIGVQP